MRHSPQAYPWLDIPTATPTDPLPNEAPTARPSASPGHDDRPVSPRLEPLKPGSRAPSSSSAAGGRPSCHPTHVTPPGPSPSRTSGKTTKTCKVSSASVPPARKPSSSFSSSRHTGNRATGRTMQLAADCKLLTIRVAMLRRRYEEKVDKVGSLRRQKRHYKVKYEKQEKKYGGLEKKHEALESRCRELGVEVEGVEGDRPGKEEVLPAVLKHIHESVDRDFLRELECPICMSTVDSAVVAGDGYMYCQACWEEYVAGQAVAPRNRVLSPMTQELVRRHAFPCYGVRTLAAAVKKAVE